MSWPQIIATSSDGSKAYVVEARSSPPENIEAYDDIEDISSGQLLEDV